MRLSPIQHPAGPTVHRAQARAVGGAFGTVPEFDGRTEDGETLAFVPPTRLAGVTAIRIENGAQPLVGGWREIDVIGMRP